MAISEAQETQIIQIVAGLFNGGISAVNLSALANLVDTGTSMADLARFLGNAPLFKEYIRR